MRWASKTFYAAATSIANHPFIEFAGLMNEYTLACQRAHDRGIDFSECNQHSGLVQPLHQTMSAHINQKLPCIFSGAKVLDTPASEAAFQQAS
jgi:hypothetical protein